jgi:hypothetical protein
MNEENGTQTTPREASESIWDEDATGSELARLMTPGLLGYYDQCEVTWIFMRDAARTTVTNVLTVVVLEEGPSPEPSTFRFLNPTPIQLKSIKSVNFGVARYRMPVTDLGGRCEATLREVSTKSWELQGAHRRHDSIRLPDHARMLRVALFRHAQG